MNRKIAAILVVVILLGLGGFLLATTGSDEGGDGAKKTGTGSEKSRDSETSNSHVPEGMTNPGSDEAVETKSVKIENFAFSPSTIKVKVGDTVTWTNEDSVRHNVVADDKSNDAPYGPLLAKGEEYTFTFRKAGTYTYHCTPHPDMKGTVIVE